MYILQLMVFEFRNASCIFFFLFVCLVFVWGGGFIFYILLFLSDWKVLYIHSKYQVCAEELWDTQRKKGTVTSPCCWAGPVRYKIQAPMWMNFGPETLPFFFNPFGLLIKRNNKQTQNTVKDACAYDSHSDWSINMTLCKVPDICYFQLLFLFHINGNRNFWSPALLIWQKQRDLTSLPHLRKQILFLIICSHLLQTITAIIGNNLKKKKKSNQWWKQSRAASPL